MALEDNKKKTEKGKKIKRRGLRFWIDPALLPTRLAQRVRDPEPSANRWVKNTETIAAGLYLNLATLKDSPDPNRRERQVLLTRLL